MKGKIVGAVLGTLLALPLIGIYSQSIQAQPNQYPPPYSEYPSQGMVRFHNHTKRALTGLYVWRSSRQEWSRNRLDYPVASGEDVRVQLSGRGFSNECNYLIRVEYSDGRTLQGNVDSCNNHHVIVERGELYQARRNPHSYDNNYPVR